MKSKHKIPAVTLLTDFGLKDGFVGVMKGVMMEINPDIKMVDICHDVPAQDIQSASFVLGQSYAYFPENTLHVVVVDPRVGTLRRIIYVEAGYYRFLAPDNGVLQYVFKWEKIFRVINVTNSDYFLPEQSSTFHGRDIFAPVAAHLTNGLDPKLLGDTVDAEVLKIASDPQSESDFIKGQIVHIDHFGNLITNVSNEMIHHILKEKKHFAINLADVKIEEISKTFYSKPIGCFLAYFDSCEYLAFAINGQNAAEKMGISIGDPFEIVFHD